MYHRHQHHALIARRPPFLLTSLYPFVKIQAYNRDDFPDKVNVGVGAYRCDQGAPFVLPVVREAEKAIIAEGMDHEYSGIVSVPF